MISFGERLKIAREQKGLTQEQVYRKTKINNKAISRYENDQASPAIDAITKLMDLYEVDANYLFGKKEAVNLQSYKMVNGDTELLKKYHLCTRQNKKYIRQIIQMFQMDEDHSYLNESIDGDEGKASFVSENKR